MRYRAIIEAPAGLAAFSLYVHGGRHCRPPISRMGNKAGYAHVLAALAGIRPGDGAGAYVWAEADADVRALLRAYPDAAALMRIAEIIRGWRDEEPRALWERLRAERKERGPVVDDTPAGWIVSVAWGSTGQWCGPDRGGACGSHPPGWVGSITLDGLTDRCHRLAEYAQVVASNRLIHVTGPDLRNTGAGGTTFGGEAFATPAVEVAGAFERVAGWAWEQGHTSPDGRLAAQYLNPEGNAEGSWKAPPRDWLATRCDRLASRWPPVAVLAALPDAETLSALLGTPGDLSGVLVYSDPDYRDTTGYAATCRDIIPALALGWSALGARVMVSESVPVPELTAHGWTAENIAGERKGQKRTFAANAGESVTMNFEPAVRMERREQVPMWGSR